MAIFMLDCDTVISAESTFSSIASQLTQLSDSVSSYDTSCEDGFDFSSAKSSIVANIEACYVKVQNTAKLLTCVVDSHTALQNGLKFGEDATLNDSTSSTTSTTGVGNYSGGGSSGGGTSNDSPGFGATYIPTNPSTPDSLEVEDAKVDNDAKDNDDIKPVEETNEKVVETKLNEVEHISVDDATLSEDSKRIFNHANFNYSSNGYGMFGNRYVISCDKSVGNVGDALTITRADGTHVDCIIGNVTENTDKNTINFYIDNHVWNANNVENISNNLLSDYSKIVNSGQINLINEVGVRVEPIPGVPAVGEVTNISIEAKPYPGVSVLNTTSVSTDSLSQTGSEV